MNIYNYDYSDMMDIPLGYGNRDKMVMTSKVYPVNLEIKVDEETNRPYMYYEGIVQTNKGAMKVTFPKLDLVLDCASVKTTSEDEIDYLGFRTRWKINNYKIVTEFNNVGEDFILYRLEFISNEDRKDIKEYFDEKYGV